jgi:hypothetical protein
VIQSEPKADLAQAKRQIESVVVVANFAVGLLLTFGGLILAMYWRVELGHVSRLRAYYLYTGWAFGTLQILAGTAMRGRWPTRWILELLPLAVPVVSSQYFLLHFVRQL